ncbi:MAG: heparinase II/III family protein [Parvibaculum sp.]|uniref:heparinase II/III family protein n=1 Tax=Parvibaculum sp. TaxID=2024848 RepID=UPI003C733988
MTDAELDQPQMTALPASTQPAPAYYAMPPGNRTTDLALAALVRLRDKALARAYASWAYGQSLRGPMPDHMMLYPRDLRPGRAETADALFQGRWSLPGGQVKTDGSTPFDAIAPSETWSEELHGFSWLRHFTAAGGDAARTYAQTLVARWIIEAGNWNDIAWRPQVIGRRLTSWVSNGALIIDGSDLIYRSTLLRNMARQARHLARTAALAPAGEPRFTAAVGLAFSGLCLSEGQKRLDKGLALVCHELDRQILADGGHVSRNPSAILSIMLDLISLREALEARRIEVPKPIRDAIDRMMPMLRFFRHGDGRLALFNGSNEGPDGAVDAVLEQDDTKGRPFGFAPHSGYQRLTAGTSYVVADTGPPPPGRYSHAAHAGCLSFEMSAGKARLVVNCGSTRVLGADWEAASRATAAQSTLSLADTSSARILRGRIGRALLGARLMEGPRRVESGRNENDAGIWLDASHNGYEKLFGLVHRRRLFLNASGDELRGEDLLVTAEDARKPMPWERARWHSRPEDPPYTIRFHLHPDARASLAHDGSNVLVRLPNGDGWQFRAIGQGGPAPITLEESVYLGAGEPTRRAEQIVVSGTVFRGEARVNWAWRRVSDRSGKQTKTQDTAPPELPELDTEQDPR